MSLSDDDILAAIPAPPRSLHLGDLQRALGLPRADRDLLLDHLDRLVARGDLERLRGKRFGKTAAGGQVIGTLTVSGRGFGFVALEDVGDDVYVDGRNLGGAMHRDRVRVELRRNARGRIEGTVVGVLEHGTRTFVATLRRGRRGAALYPQDERLPDSIPLVGDTPAPDGALVAAEIVDYPDAFGRVGAARLIKVFDHEGEAAEETDVIVYDLGLPVAFDPEAEREAAAWPEELEAEEVARREDLRERGLVTIDPESAKDFDDAIHAVPLEAGGWRLTVAIADVGHYVQPGTALDREAFGRGTSVYLPDRVLPMLPHRLSADLCSLRPEVDRFALAVEFEVSRDGAIGATRLSEAVIRSHARFTYDQAGRMLGIRSEADTPQPSADPEHERLRPTLECLLHATRALRRGRRQHGYLEIVLAEPRIFLDAEGAVEDIRPAPHHEAHQLVEEAMLAANRAVGRLFVRAEHPSLFRVHDRPGEKGLERFRRQAAALGAPMKLDGPVGAKALSKYLKGVADHAQRPLLNQLLLRSMARAVYSADVGPHFGLGADAYLHFTSPIRRYPDMVVHRLLKAALQDQDTPSHEALTEIARHSSRRERLAVDAERTVQALYKAIFLEGHRGEIFDGTVIAVVGMGLFVQLDEHLVEGLLHVESLDDDYYELDAEGESLVGRRTHSVYALGDRLRVRVHNVNIRRRRVDFRLERRLPRLR